MRTNRFPFAALVAMALTVAAPAAAAVPDDLAIWKEFTGLVRSGGMTLDRIRPFEGVRAEDLLKGLQDLKSWHDQVKTWDEWNDPRVFPAGDQVSFLVGFTWGQPQRNEFLFIFLKEGGRWYYRQLENIQLRLDLVPPPPTSEFPDLPETTKAWMREEFYWSQLVHFYGLWVKEIGRDAALVRLTDGAGYFLAARVWCPLLPAPRAFVLYACWEQGRLRGNGVELLSLDDRKAEVLLKPQFFLLYRNSGHLRNQIAFPEYKAIFEALWRDRAREAGWRLAIAYEDTEALTCRLTFTRD